MVPSRWNGKQEEGKQRRASKAETDVGLGLWNQHSPPGYPKDDAIHGV